MGSLPYCEGCRYDNGSVSNHCMSCCFGSKYERSLDIKWGIPVNRDITRAICDTIRHNKEDVKKKERKPMSKTKKVTIKKVIFNDPVTIVIWSDKTKTIVRTQGCDIYDPEKGLAMAISKKMLGDNKGNYYNEFKKWLPEEKVVVLTDKSSLYPVRPIKFNLDTSKFRNYVGRRAAALGEKQDGEK